MSDSLAFPPQAKTLAVSNADSTDDVIRMALLQFGISVSNQRPLLIFTPVHTHFCPFDVVSKVIRADSSYRGQVLLNMIYERLMSRPSVSVPRICTK